MTDSARNDDTDTWKRSPFAPGENEPQPTEKLGLEGLSTEEKLDRIAGATVAVAKQVEQVADRVEQMASAHGESQQADPGRRADRKTAVWGEDSPFASGSDR